MREYDIPVVLGVCVARNIRLCTSQTERTKYPRKRESAKSDAHIVLQPIREIVFYTIKPLKMRLFLILTRRSSDAETGRATAENPVVSQSEI